MDKVEVKSIEGKILIEFSIPYRQLAFELRANKLVDDIEISWQIKNEKGEVIWSERETEEVALGENEREKLIKGFFSKQKQVALEPGNYLIEVSVREKRGKVLILRKIPWQMSPGF